MPAAPELTPGASRMPDVIRRLLVLVGPTASGKTPVSLFLASRLNGEILSADSRQVYRFMDIGTAKPTVAQRNEVRHHFVDELEPAVDFNAGEFGKTGRRILADVYSREKTPIVVGGSGLYVRALVDGLFDGPSADSTVRKMLTERLRNEGADALLRELRAIDPESASKMLPSNTRRIVRALEVYHLTGTPISVLQQQRASFGFIPVFAGLQWDRKTLYDRIDTRTDHMLADGLVNEVENLRKMGYDEDTNSLQTVGYKEVLMYLHGRLDYPSMVELIKRNSRRYAKRQLTWFRSDNRIRWFDVRTEEEFPEIANQIVRYFLTE